MSRSALLTVASAVLIALPALACSGGGETEAADEMTRREKDSLISTMPIPGAGGVGNALEISDSLRSRALRHDTIG